MDRNRPLVWLFVKLVWAEWSSRVTGSLSAILVLVGLGINIAAMFGVKIPADSFIQIGTWLLAAICGGQAAYSVWARERKEVRNLNERLTPNFIPSFATGRNGIVTSPVGVADNKEHFAAFVRIHIDTISDTMIKECRVILYAIYKLNTNTGQFEQVFMPHPLDIKDTPVAVYPGIPTVVDFLRCDSPVNRLRFPGYMPFVMEHTLDDPGTYRFVLKVNGDGLTRAVGVDLQWKGQWNTIIASQTESATLRAIEPK